MQGKAFTKDILDSTLNIFLEDDLHLILGFEKDNGGVGHKVFRKNVGQFILVNPAFGANGALYLRRLFSKASQVLLFLRPCEIRAYVELTKLTQVEREAVTAVSIDCFGAVSLKDENDTVPVEIDALRDYFKDTDKMRPACRSCKERRGVVGDAGIRFDARGALWLVPYTEKGEKLASSFPGVPEEIPGDLLIAESSHTGKLQTNMAEFTKDLSKCILCKNCRNMCPVCYCLDCVFNGDEYLPKGDALINMVLRTGSEGIPQGKELFHLIRMYHVSQTCVGCGACEEACPQGIPLARYFQGVSERLQGIFSYVSGRSFDEQIPLVTFAEDELKEYED